MPAQRLRIVKWTGPVLMIGLCGCGGARDGLPRQEISGTVTLNAAPLPQGTIQFLPAVPSAGATNTPAPAGAESAANPAGTTALSAPITEGKFAIERAKGLVPGSYKVQVYGADLSAVPADAAPGLEPPQPKETIPKRYNTATTLTAVVKEDGPNTYEFQLTK